MDTAVQFVSTILAIMVLVWVGTEGIGTTFGLKKKYVSAVAGVIFGLAAHGTGFLPTGDVMHGWTGWPWVLAGLSGLFASSCTSIGHYYIKRLTGGGK